MSLSNVPHIMPDMPINHTGKSRVTVWGVKWYYDPEKPSSRPADKPRHLSEKLNNMGGNHYCYMRQGEGKAIWVHPGFIQPSGMERTGRVSWLMTH